ncbi:MAG: IS66 family transposase [Sandaracinaceae bacterium]|nr:IS66 family transposase [Sandaracinaceae bacterium]
MDLRHESDIEQLRRIALAQEGQIRILLKVLQDKCAELRRLTGHEEELQQTLALITDLQRKSVAAETASTTPRKRPKNTQTGHGPSEQPALPHVDVEVDLDEADRVCTSCGGQLDEWVGQFEESELVDVVEVQYRVVKVKRKKYRCGCGGYVATADGGPERVVPGGRYSLTFGAKVATDKHLDHQPLERQVRILKRHGLKVTSQTLWDQLYALSTELEPTYQALLAAILEHPVVGVDQTSWPRLHKGKELMTPWQMWCVTAPGAAYHTIRADKSAESFVELLGTFEGSIICDAASTHTAGIKSNDKAFIAFCWAHALRKLRDVEDDHPEVHTGLALIRQLYDIDSEAGDDIEARRTFRDTRSRRVVDELRLWLLANIPRHPKTTAIGNALRYPIRNWEGFKRFLDDPHVPLDNNATERGLRGPVVGRKNHYGSKSDRGTRAAAILYSLLETAKLQDVEPTAYLVEAVRAARRGEVLLPGALGTN